MSEARAELPLVTVVIVTYNNADHIDACLESVVGQLPSDESRVVIVDNASGDATADLVESRWPEVRLLRSPVNLGFARACNIACDGASSRYFLFANPDAVLEPGCIDALLDLARRHPAAGLYGGRGLSLDGDLDSSSCFGRPTLWSLFCFATGLSSIRSSSMLFNPEGMGEWPRDTERAVDIVSGFLLLIDAGIWRRLEGFDERFFMYGEDFDLSIRSRTLGCRPMVTPAAGIVHVGGASSSPVNKEILLYRGKVSLIRKLWPGQRRAAAERMLATGVWMRSRLAGGRARAVLTTPDGGHLTTPGTWAELWRRRDEWRAGWAMTSEGSLYRLASAGHAIVRVEEQQMNGQIGATASEGAELTPRAVYGRARLAARVAKFGVRSAQSSDWDFCRNSARSFIDLVALSAADLIPTKHGVTCNMCGWTGRAFYPNTGPGYDERNSLCPGCLCSDRYRTLYETLRERTTVFTAGVRTIEVAPLPSLERIFLSHPELRYTSFDIARPAMEHGDLTAMRYEDDSVDWFICFHVLEHVPDEMAALDEIHRVLRPGGSAILQVPVDWDVAETREYGAPDPRDVGHVRRHGRDFAARVGARGFTISEVDPVAEFGPDRVREAGLSPESIFVARADKAHGEAAV